MAALSCGTCKCYCSKLFAVPKKALAVRYAVLRAFSSQVETDKIESSSRRKTRDRLTVLKALSSTVERVPNRPDYRFYDDTVLNPRSLLRQKELLLAMESGEKAADYVLQKYPELFPLRKPVPEWPKSHSADDIIEDTVENLQFLIQHEEDKKSKVLDMYENLKAAGDLSIDVHNIVLDFVSFHGIVESSQGTDHIEPSTSDTSTSSSSSEDEGGAVKTEDSQTKSTWRSDYAESLFTELKEVGNSKTYEVFILALLKHGEFIRAFHLFREFEKKELSGTLFFYNKLLSHVTDVRNDDTGKWDLVQEIIGSMKKNSIRPDTVTYNNLLGMVSTMDKNPQQLSHELLREMKKLKIAPTLGCYYHILFTERKKSYQNIHLLLEIVSDLKSGIVDFNFQHPTDTLFFHSAMDLTRFKRHSVIARDLLDIVLNNNLLHLLAGKQSAFFGNYLCAIARNARNIDDVMEEYENTVPKYFIPRDWVYQQLLLACRNLKQPEHVPRLYTDIVVMRVVLSDRLANALYAAMEENIPKENVAAFVNVVKDSLKWMEVFRVKMTPEILSTSIKVFCLDGLYEDARMLMEDAKRRNMTPSFSSILDVLRLNLEQGDKKSAMNTLKYMSGCGMQIDDDLKNLITGDELLSEESEKIISWFNC